MFAANEIADRVRTQRKNLGLTQAEVAERAGTSVQTVARVEKGVGSGVAFETMTRIFNAVGYDIALEPYAGAPVPASSLADIDIDRYLEEHYYGG